MTNRNDESSPLARVPSGVQIHFGEEARLRRAVERRVLAVLAGWSYEEVLLPIFDYEQLFRRGMGPGRIPRTYRFTDHEGALLALRPELTTLVARTVATRMRDAATPLRLSYSGEVFRWDPPRQGRQSEFHQVGLELIGQKGVAADLEVLAVCAEVLRSLGLDGFRISLSHVGFLQGVADGLGLDRAEAETFRALMDRRDGAALRAFLDRSGEHEKNRRFSRLTTLSGGAEILREARDVVFNPTSRAALTDLQALLDGAEAAGLNDSIAVDLGAVADFAYYTGPTFQVFVPGLGSALGGGGRYDRLMQQFGLDLPAVGFSLCLDWMVEQVGSTALSDELLDAPAPTQITADSIEQRFRAASEARARGASQRTEHTSTIAI